MMNQPKGETISFVLRLTVVSLATFWSVKWLMNHLDPTNKSKKKAKEAAVNQLKRMDFAKNKIAVENLSDYELMIAAHIVNPKDIDITWDDIAGLEDLIQELRETVILPIQHKDLFADSLLTRAPKGVLLHGPPGCGKTLIAKATAREAGTFFINLDVSILTDKWYGESQKLASAVFSLAVKLQPCIIFIDEIDSFLRARNSTDHEATAMMKAQFMSLWDGLITDPNCTVMVMGATNRPQDLDRAILRRMPATFHVAMPNVAQRRQILSLILENEPVAPDVDVESIAMSTEGFSGSDLKELCRIAAVSRLRGYVQQSLNRRLGLNGEDDSFHDALRPIMMDDLKLSFGSMRESKIQCGSLTTQSRIELD